MGPKVITTMINENTQNRVAELGEIIANASEELAQLLRDISTEADEQLAAAAAMYVAEHGKDNGGIANRLMSSYRQAHRGLLDASVNASNIQEMAERANTLRSKCDWWKVLGDLKKGDDRTRRSSNCGPIIAVLEAFFKKQATDTDAAGDAMAHRMTHD